jgi:hypothetical protein
VPGRFLSDPSGTTSIVPPVLKGRGGDVGGTSHSVECGERIARHRVPVWVTDSPDWIHQIGNSVPSRPWNRKPLPALDWLEGSRVKMRVRTRTSSGHRIRPELERRRKHSILIKISVRSGFGQGACAIWSNNLQNYGARQRRGDAVRGARRAITNPSACERFDARSSRASGRAACRPCPDLAHSGSVSSDPWAYP